MMHNGNIPAARIPAFRLSLKNPDTKPVKVGPSVQPTSPARAIKAKEAVLTPVFESSHHKSLRV